MTVHASLSSLRRQLHRARDLSHWRQLAAELDERSGADLWKRQPESTDYDWALIHQRLQQLRSARNSGSVQRLLFHLHEGLHGNLGNLSSPALYRHSLLGTKQLVEDYLREVCAALEHVCHTDFPDLDPARKRAFFDTTGSAFGRSALMLSGGATLGLFHIGVCKALHQEQLLPTVISGSSAGAIIAAVLGTHTDAELDARLQPDSLYLNAFRHVGWRGLLRGRPVLDGSVLERCLSENIPDMTFAEAHQHSGREINIPVSPYDRHQQSRLLNWRTSPHVLIRKAVLASCAIPGIFPPVRLWARDFEGRIVPYIPGRRFVDGSIQDDLPVKRLARLYGVNHTLVSQTNPHVLPFLPRRTDRLPLYPGLNDWLLRNLSLNLGQALDLLQRHSPSQEAALLLDKARSVLTQRYVGDINLIPPRRPLGVLRVLSNPSVEDVRAFIDRGERATWPLLDMIHNTTCISRTFEQCRAHLQERATEWPPGTAARPY